jgi:hypothetical protein
VVLPRLAVLSGIGHCSLHAHNCGSTGRNRS